jgi:hypothetical protein
MARVRINHLVLQTICDTTQSADGANRGVIFEDKPGDWVWWTGSVILLAAIPTMPMWIPYVQNVWKHIVSLI